MIDGDVVVTVECREEDVDCDLISNGLDKEIFYVSLGILYNLRREFDKVLYIDGPIFDKSLG